MGALEHLNLVFTLQMLTIFYQMHFTLHRDKIFPAGYDGLESKTFSLCTISVSNIRVQRSGDGSVQHKLRSDSNLCTTSFTGITGCRPRAPSYPCWLQIAGGIPGLPERCKNYSKQNNSKRKPSLTVCLWHIH